jgi:predicted nuclease of predicted toxin-antitoxin system
LKLKLDENLGSRGQILLREAGFDVSTVFMQNLCGCPDRQLIDICRIESRCMVTMDLDFSNPIQFPPEKSAGIVVLRTPRNPSLDDILACLRTFIQGVPKEDLAGKLRVISNGRIREYSRG